MRNLFLFSGLLLITNLIYGQTINQELISSSGNSYNNANYQIDWSLGECVTETIGNSEFTITQGFHQGNYQITIINDFNSQIIMSVFPNPTTDFICLQSKNTDKNENFVVCITDINGKYLFQKKLVNNDEKFDFSQYSCGIYFLSVKSENQLIKSFKIIKN